LRTCPGFKSSFPHDSDPFSPAQKPTETRRCLLRILSARRVPWTPPPCRWPAPPPMTGGSGTVSAPASTPSSRTAASLPRQLLAACTVTACFWRFDFVLFFLLSCANVDVDALCFSVVARSGVWAGEAPARGLSDAYLRSRLRRRVAGAALRHPHQRAEGSIRFDTPISSPIAIHCHVGGDLTAAVGLCGRE
jgi:hypothetical protein